jgi:hypothetical protein
MGVAIYQKFCNLVENGKWKKRMCVPIDIKTWVGKER